ncbi:hypothetical protein ACHAW5_006652 [Stephanodiscus triporus]|uniref:Uncharacterized protein n=1 Tax=Stephanodiscus triporus TaxID=2934178 RepID=A0ABD3N329_9STRA
MAPPPPLALVLPLLLLLLAATRLAALRVASPTGATMIDVVGTARRGGRVVGHYVDAVGATRTSSSSSSSSLLSSLEPPRGNNDRPPPRRRLVKASFPSSIGARCVCDIGWVKSCGGGGRRKNKRRTRLDEISAGGRRGENKKKGYASVIDGDFSFGGGGTTTTDDDDDDGILDVEIRPARRRDAVEAGLDYWMDESDLKRERQRRIAVRDRRRRMSITTRTTTRTTTTTTTTGRTGEEDGVGGMPMYRLREEVVAPYKQNWIGLLSIFIVALSAIVTKFPELLQIPIIPIPDL